MASRETFAKLEILEIRFLIFLSLLHKLLFGLLLPVFLYGQAAVGVVTDDDGKPLGGANVVVEGTEKGGVTDESGRYTIDLGKPGDYVLTASFIGYSPLTAEVKVGDIVVNLLVI